MIKSENLGLITYNGESCYDIDVVIDNEDFPELELSGIFNELKHRGYEYSQIEAVLNQIYSTNAINRVTELTEGSCLN